MIILSYVELDEIISLTLFQVWLLLIQALLMWHSNLGKKKTFLHQF